MADENPLLEPAARDEAAPPKALYLLGVQRARSWQWPARVARGAAERSARALPRPGGAGAAGHRSKCRSLDPDALQEHQRAVESAMRRGTILPAPFGLVFHGRRPLIRMLQEQYLVLDEALVVSRRPVRSAHPHRLLRMAVSRTMSCCSWPTSCTPTCVVPRVPPCPFPRAGPPSAELGLSGRKNSLGRIHPARRRSGHRALRNQPRHHRSLATVRLRTLRRLTMLVDVALPVPIPRNFHVPAQPSRSARARACACALPDVVSPAGCWDRRTGTRAQAAARHRSRAGERNRVCRRTFSSSAAGSPTITWRRSASCCARRCLQC